MAVASAAGTVREALGSSADALSAAGIPAARFDAELLLSEAMAVDRARLAADPEAPVPSGAGRAFGLMVRRRLQREPVAYILGRKGFRNIELTVDPRVLIPRPETELLVEVALEAAPASMLDIGTGSGAIALAVADELPGCEVTATDTSPGALEVATANARRLGFGDRVRFIEGTVPDGEDFDLIVSNPPYIETAAWPGIQPEITNFEPREALLAGVDGLDAYRSIAPSLSVPVVAFEIGEGQGPAVAALLGAAGYSRTETRADLAGIERVVIGRR